MNQFGFMPQYQMPLQRQEVLRVNGENGARMISMAPNSSILALDENEPLVWFAQSDGAGYKTVTAYKIVPVRQEQQASINDLAARIEKLEGIINAKSDHHVNDAEQTEEHRQPRESVPREKPAGSNSGNVFY